MFEIYWIFFIRYERETHLINKFYMIINYASNPILYQTTVTPTDFVSKQTKLFSLKNNRLLVFQAFIVSIINQFNIKETTNSLKNFSFVRNITMLYLTSTTKFSLLNFITDPEITNNYKVVNPRVGSIRIT